MLILHSIFLSGLCVGFKLFGPFRNSKVVFLRFQPAIKIVNGSPSKALQAQPN